MLDMVTALTPNEATLYGALLGGLVGGIVSFMAARYTITHGPNYQQQINDMRKTLEALANTQEDFRQDEKQRDDDAKSRAEAARWKPKARIVSVREGNEQSNKLVLDASSEFALTEASLISSSGAKLHAYPMNKSAVYSLGCSVNLDQGSLLQIAKGLQHTHPAMKFAGSVRYTVLRKLDETTYEGEVPFVAETLTICDVRLFKLGG